MKAEELRLRNLVYSYENKLQTVYGILIENNFQKIFTDKDANLYFHVDGLRPIQLTEEWLVKAGFEKEEEYEFGVLICYRYILETRKTNCVFTSNYSTEECIYVNYNQGGVDIEYVHQLQNLYFALTGTELTINNQKQIK